MGTIKLERELFVGGEFNNSARFKVFATLLVWAEDAPVTKEGEQLGRGELVTSLSRLSRRASVTVKQARNALAALVKLGKIVVRTTPQHTVVTICDYDYYVV